MKAMNTKIRLVDVPSDISPGSIELRPLDPITSRLTVCSQCKCFSANAFLAVCGHSFCSSCATVRPAENAPETTIRRITQLWCHFCKSRKDAERNEVTLSVENMRFACNCGFEGKLREIKQHFWVPPDENGHREVVEEGEHEPEDVQPTEQASHLILEHLREQIDRCVADIHELRNNHENSRNEVLARKGGKQYIAIHIKDLIDQHREKRSEVWSSLYRWWGDGYPCATQVHIDQVKNVSWLGVYHQTFLEAATEPWPMKKRIRFEILTCKGEVVKSYEAPVYVNGKSISKCFAAPLKDGGYGLSRVIRVDKLSSNGDIVADDGILIITVEAVAL